MRLRRAATIAVSLVAAAMTVAVQGQPASAGPVGVSGTINISTSTVWVFRDWNFNESLGTYISDTNPPNSSLGWAMLAPYNGTYYWVDWDGFWLPKNCRMTGYTYHVLSSGQSGRTFNTAYADTQSHGYYIKMGFDEKLVVTAYSCFYPSPTPPNHDPDDVEEIKNNPAPPNVPSAPPTAPASGATSGIGVKRNDYNNDGRSDIVAVRDDCLHRWKGVSGAGFEYVGVYGCGWSSYASTLTAVGDFNRDGYGDLVAVRDDCLHRWKGIGGFGFEYLGTYGCGWAPYASTLTGAGDINRDGVGDLVAVRDGVLYKWYGDGSGGFDFRGDWGPGWDAYHALTGAGDLNGDGNGDLVAVKDNCLHQWNGDGNGGFNYQGNVGCGWEPYAATLTGMGDINGNGRGDLIAVSADGYLHRWSGAQTYLGTYGPGWGAYVLAG